MARLNLQENAVSPPTPAPGFASIYFKNDNVLYIKDSTGLESPIGSSSSITALTGDVTATGPGSVPATIVSVGGASAANIASAVAAYLTATSLATANTLVQRDALGNARFATPLNTADAATKGYVDTEVFNIPVDHGIANIAGVIQAIFGSTSDTIVEGNDNRLSTTNLLKVKKNPGAGEFLTIESAMASITTNSSTNPFAIEWGPGVYTINNSSGPLVIKPYVTIYADGQYATIAEPQDPSQDLFLVNNAESALRNIIIQNVTGISAAAIRVTRSEVPFLLDHVKVINCTESLVIESTSFPSEVAARSFRCVSGPDTVRFCRIISSSGQSSVLRIYTSLLTEDDGTSFSSGFYITGTGARLDANTVLLRSSANIGDGIIIRDGGEFVSQSGAEIEGFDQNLFVENTGVAPTIRTTVIMLRQGVTWDLNIEHPGTKGSINAKVNTDTGTFVDSSAPVKLILTDPSNLNTTGLFVKGDILQADRFDRKANVSLIVREGTTLGVVSGGIISIVAGLQVNITSGKGFLDDPTDGYLKEIDWSSSNLNLAANSDNYIYVDTDAIVTANTVLPSLETVIPLGRVVTGSSLVDFIENSELSMEHIGNKVEYLLRSGLGPIFGTGAVVTENATPLNLDVTGGQYFYGTSVFTISGGSAISWESIYQDGGGDFILGTQSVVDNAFYDDGSGTLAAIPSTYYAKHTLYVVGDDGDEKYFLVYAQAAYPTLVEAQNDVLPLTPSFIKDAVTRIAGIVVQQGQPNLIETIDIRPRLGFAAPATTAASDHGNLTGLLDDDHPQYLIRTGIRPMTGPLTSTDTTQSTDKDTGSVILDGGVGVEKNINAGGNINAVGTISASNFSGSSSSTNTGDVTITDTNSIDLTLASQNISADLKLSADAASASNLKATTTIHADGLHIEYPYATPVQIGTSNFIGAASSFALSDHVHAHGNQTSGTLHAVVTTSVNGFMIAADKTKLDTISATAATNAQILISDTTTYNPRTISGDAIITNAGVLTVNSVGGSSASNINSAELAANAATSANTPSTIVKRDGSGNFSAGTITASLTGNATNVTGVVAVANGGTGASTASAARVNLNIDERTTFSNANYTVLSTDRYVAQIGTMSAPRTVTLPAANSVNAGQKLIIADESGTVSTTNLITVTAAGGDTIDGSASKTIRSAYGEADLTSNGTNMWYRPVTGIGAGGTGLSTTPTDGQLLIGSSTNSNYVQSTLTAGTGITVTNGSGSITVANNSIVNTTTKTANYTITATDDIIFVDTTGGAFTLTLPNPSTLAGKLYRIIGTSGTMQTNNLTLARFGSEKIEGLAASKIFQTNWGWFTVTTNGTDWFTQ